MTTDAELVEAALRGSRSAVGELFDRYWPDVWRAAYAVIGSRELADDVAQDAFVGAVERLATFDPGRPIRPWLERIAVNRAIDVLRRERRLVPLDGRPEPAGTAASEPDDALFAALRRLSADRRLVVALHYWLDYSLEETAALLAVPTGTVASRLSRALRDLRLDLEAHHV